MKKKIFLISLMSLLLTVSTAYAQHPQHLFYRPIVLSLRLTEPPVIIPVSLDQPMPCDIEAYQTEDGVEIIVNDVSLSGLYQISVFDHRLDRVYNTSVLFYDGASAFISTDLWPEDTYYLQIIIPGGWLEGEFEIDN